MLELLPVSVLGSLLVSEPCIFANSACSSDGAGDFACAVTGNVFLYSACAGPGIVACASSGADMNSGAGFYNKYGASTGWSKRRTTPHSSALRHTTRHHTCQTLVIACKRLSNHQEVFITPYQGENSHLLTIFLYKLQF